MGLLGRIMFCASRRGCGVMLGLRGVVLVRWGRGRASVCVLWGKCVLWVCLCVL